jgi:hypothetical protein
MTELQLHPFSWGISLESHGQMQEIVSELSAPNFYLALEPSDYVGPAACSSPLAHAYPPTAVGYAAPARLRSPL